MHVHADFRENGAQISFGFARFRIKEVRISEGLLIIILLYGHRDRLLNPLLCMRSRHSQLGGHNILFSSIIIMIEVDGIIIIVVTIIAKIFPVKIKISYSFLVLINFISYGIFIIRDI